MEGQEPTVNPPAGQEPAGTGGQEPDKTTPDTGGDGNQGQGQEPDSFDADYVKQLRQDAAKTRKALQAAEAKLNELADRDKTEQQKLTERAEAAETAAADATGRLLRYEVAADKKLTSDWVDRLRGDTREELEADADRLLAQLAEQYQPPPPTRTSAYDGGARTRTAEKRSPEQEHNQLLLGLLGRK